MSTPPAPPLTVDRDQLLMWSEGILLSHNRGQGVAVNELECQGAEDALERGEIVLLREGARLTGTHIMLVNGVIQERPGFGISI